MLCLCCRVGVILPFLETREPPAPYTACTVALTRHSDRWHPGFSKKRALKERYKRTVNLHNPLIVTTLYSCKVACRSGSRPL